MDKVFLNCWKHHAGFIKEQIKLADDIDQLARQSRVIGKGLMDLYFGMITPTEICKIISSQLSPAIIKSEYLNWLKEEGNDFRLLKLSDESIWVLRMGDDNEKFIHIHPARYSPFTLRVKAGSLKTAICASAWNNLNYVSIDLNVINKIRIEYLNLSPVKSIASIPALNNIIKLLTS